ncbi:hypothetical protein GUJ93_ZPchr0458g22770 [Zizania palustris]|uniref:Uncharacterized protein n=1 Tax=Zizania palustris TaxID=103762 RepID=A0A8J5QVJ9_ZIZPA|nr:hypothetical protein GUJ93_ZPchr0458g22770 [Zizania palustris]
MADKTATSVHSTPALSPMGSPRHSVGRDSSSRFSGHTKRKPDKSAGRNGAPAGKGWQEISVIEEEGLPRRRRPAQGHPQALLLLPHLRARALWGQPQIVIISYKHHVRELDHPGGHRRVPGADGHGDHQLDSKVQLPQHWPGTFFGIHVTADPFQLSYSQLTLASGDLNKFYQARSSRRTVSVGVTGNKVPLYGGGRR